MRFTLATAIAIFGATAFAQLAREKIDIADLSVWKSDADGSLQSVSFKLTGADGAVDCAAENPGSLPTDTFPCGESGYKFVLDKGEQTEFALFLDHTTDQ